MKRICRMVMVAAATIVFGSLAQAGDMEGLYGAYQAAVQEGDEQEVLKAAEAVHRYAEGNYPETSGFAENIEILETDGSSSFGLAAVEFLEPARYAPRFIEGEPVDTPEREMKFSFHLAK